MANGNCPVGARHDEAIEELRRHVEKLTVSVERVCAEVGELKVNDRIRKAELTLRDKIWVAVITCLVGPVVVALVVHYLG